MGFRDLHCFNQAMLAKQGWRLICEPHSLCAQLLQAKYYPDGNLFKAELKKGASFTWRIMMSGLKTLRRGAVWRPGNGANIKIWPDLWIPTTHGRCVLTPRGHCLLEWDVHLIHDNFWHIDANRILQISLPSQDQPDFMAWQLCKSGVFTIRSAYHAEWKAEYRTRADVVTDMAVWKLLWE